MAPARVLLGRQATHDVSTGTTFQTELFRYFTRENLATHWVGALAMSILVAINVEILPWWAWVPWIVLLWAVTFWRMYLFDSYERHPGRHDVSRLGRQHTVGAIIAGVCWGAANTLMGLYVPLGDEMLIAATWGVSAGYAAAAAFAFNRPAKYFILIASVPLVVSYFVKGDGIHLGLAILFCLHIPMTLLQMQRRSRALAEALRLRLENEALVQELAAQKDAAEAAVLAKHRFLSAASHDLRQPVQALVIYLELLSQEAQLSPRGREYYERLQAATEEVSGLLDSLLHISRLEAGMVSMHREVLPVRRLFDQMQGEFASEAQRKGLRLDFAPCHAQVLTDRTLIGQVLRNLIGNAIRYTREGRILVGCRHRGLALEFQVLDTGIGIEPEHQQAIFGEFYQVQNRHRDRQQGLGLGLAIAARTAQVLGTRIELASQPGRGSRFSFRVALAETSPIPTRAGPHDLSHASPRLTGCRVALVENEDAVRLSTVNMLTQWGCKVRAAPSLAELRLLLAGSDEPVDLLISDYGLSARETALDVVAATKQHQGEPFHVLVLTGDTSPETLRRLGSHGLSVLHKPATADMFRRALLALLGEAPAVAEVQVQR